MIIERCALCGREFEKADKSEARFCSDECRQEQRRRIEAEKPPRRVTCKRCGKVFYTKERRQKYCSEACEKKSYAVNNGYHNLYAPNLGKKVEK